MNITMEEVVFTDARGAKVNFDSFFVQNRLIRWRTSLTWSPGHLVTWPPGHLVTWSPGLSRYIQIPASVDLREALAAASQPRGRGRGRGRGEVSRHRAKILEARDARRKEDLKNALKFKEEWRRDREEKERREKQ